MMRILDFKGMHQVILMLYRLNNLEEFHMKNNRFLSVLSLIFTAFISSNSFTSEGISKEEQQSIEYMQQLRREYELPEDDFEMIINELDSWSIPLAEAILLDMSESEIKQNYQKYKELIEKKQQELKEKAEKAKSENRDILDYIEGLDRLIRIKKLIDDKFHGRKLKTPELDYLKEAFESIEPTVIGSGPSGITSSIYSGRRGPQSVIISGGQ